MAVDARGTHGQPYFNDTLGFDLGADQGAIGDYASAVGNRIVDHSSNRAGLTSIGSPSAWEGLDYYEYDTKLEYRYTGGIWVLRNGPWAAYTPNTTGISYGSGGLLSAEYRYVGGRVVYHGSITLGTSGSITDCSVSMPVTPRAGVGFEGELYGIDASAGFKIYALKPLFSSVSGNAYFIARSLGGSPVALSPLTPSTPMTWTNGDQFNWSFSFDPA